MMKELDYSKSPNRTITAELPNSQLLGSDVPGFIYKFLLIPRHKTITGLLAALTGGWAVSQLIASPLLGPKGVAFIETIAAGIVLWVSETFDDYVVGLLVFLSWMLIVPLYWPLVGLPWIR
jgi:hypothetical protein